MTQGEPGDIEERVRRLEESQGFAEHGARQLEEEVRALGRRVAELQGAVRRLEASLLRLAAPPPDSGELEQE